MPARQANHPSRRLFNLDGARAAGDALDSPAALTQLTLKVQVDASMIAQSQQWSRRGDRPHWRSPRGQVGTIERLDEQIEVRLKNARVVKDRVTHVVGPACRAGPFAIRGPTVPPALR